MLLQGEVHSNFVFTLFELGAVRNRQTDSRIVRRANS